MRKILGLTAIVAAGMVTALVAEPVPAKANCYETIGCSNSQYFKLSDLKQLSCQALWEVRNWIYKENGYCFHTPRGIKTFGNAGCLYDEEGQVPLNEVEKYNASAIKKIEAARGC
jgi:hypothetical protein